jgi:glutamate racemase
MRMKPENPIGIFDSGLGGLTVARAVRQHLPNESIIYFGDTLNAPWGDKSVAAIGQYVIKICRLLIQEHCKLILIACNTASSVAFDLVRDYAGIPVLNVIDPVVDYLKQHHAQQSVGLIGTKQTIASEVYQKKLQGSGIRLCALTTPLLAPLIEEGLVGHHIATEAINYYLSMPVLRDIQALVLGCTHYPLLKSQIRKFYRGDFSIIDSTDVLPKNLKNSLIAHDLLNRSQSAVTKFYVSDYTPMFAKLTRLFFSESVHLKRIDL